jgi:hypothetical protein
MQLFEHRCVSQLTIAAGYAPMVHSVSYGWQVRERH